MGRGKCLHMVDAHIERPQITAKRFGEQGPMPSISISRVVTSPLGWLVIAIIGLVWVVLVACFLRGIYRRLTGHGDDDG